MSDDDARDDGRAGGGDSPADTGKKKRGRPRGSGAGRPPTSRFTRRAEKSEKTIRELLALGKPDLDVEGLSFLDVVDRDVAAWGRFFAQLGEWFVPFGSAIDLFFGSPLVVLLNMAPSVRAARRDFRARRELRAAELADEREREQLQAEREDELADARRQAAETGVFVETPGGMTREEWLSAGGGGA